MNDVQHRIYDLKQKGWTIAAIGDEIGVTSRGVDHWQAGRRYPHNAKAILIVLDSLLKRKRIPKQRRYAPGSRKRSPKQESTSH